jgi:hypothetical protein
MSYAGVKAPQKYRTPAKTCQLDPFRDSRSQDSRFRDEDFRISGFWVRTAEFKKRDSGIGILMA